MRPKEKSNIKNQRAIPIDREHIKNKKEIYHEESFEF